MEFHLAFFFSGGVTNTLPPELRKKGKKKCYNAFHIYKKNTAYRLIGTAQNFFYISSVFFY